MASVIQANPETWLPVLRTRLQEVTLFPAERVKIVARKRVPMPHTQDILLRLGGFKTQTETTFSAGRVCTVLTRELLVTARTRLAVDPSEDDEKWVTDGTLGHLQLEAKILNALQGYQPVDAQQNWLVTEPLQILYGPAPAKDESADDGASTLVFSVSYLPTVSHVNYL